MKNYIMVGLFSVIALLSLSSCGSSGSTGTSTTTTDAAFPSSVGVDVSTVASTNLQNVDFSIAKADGIPDTGSMSGPITTATNMADLVVKLTDHIFSGVSSSFNNELEPDDVQVSGIAFGGTITVDFHDYGYDVNGDGTNDPCSGSAKITSTPTYACFRAWFTDSGNTTSRLMIGYIETVPTATTIGKGKAIVDPTLVADTDQVQGMGEVMTYIAWDNTSASSNEFDGYMSGAMATNMELTVGRIVASYDPATGKMTLRTGAFFSTPSTIGIPAGPGGQVVNYQVSEVLFNSQFILTGTNLLFENHFYDAAGDDVAQGQNDTPFCGVIATGDPAAANPATITACTNEGISLSGVEYPSLAETDASKTVFPSTDIFPLTPPAAE